MARLLFIFLLLAGAARAQGLLDADAVPALDDAGRASYRRWLTVNLPRALAIGSNGRVGWHGGGGTVEQARSNALAQCEERGGLGCAIYAENLGIVWPGRETPAPLPPPALISSFSYDFTPDPRFLWRGPAAARGVYVWAHGKGPTDSRGVQPQSHVRPLNNAGFDVLRFDRYTLSDERDRAAAWLRDGLRELRRQGYRSVIVGGQSRGGWNSLQMLAEPGLADLVVAVSPAAHGMGGDMVAGAQTDDLRGLLAAIPAQAARLVFVQFQDDLFIGDAESRRRLIEQLRPRLAGLLVLDRPAEFSGHQAGEDFLFGLRFGGCLQRFALDPQPPDVC